MKKILSTVALTSLLALCIPVVSLAADAQTDAQQVKLQAEDHASLQRAVASATRAKDAKIEVTSTAHQITVSIVDSDLNDAARTERSVDASSVAAAIEKEISTKQAFSGVGTIHVDYVKRILKISKVVQGFDFNKAPSGRFLPHMS